MLLMLVGRKLRQAVIHYEDGGQIHTAWSENHQKLSYEINDEFCIKRINWLSLA